MLLIKNKEINRKPLHYIAYNNKTNLKLQIWYINKRVLYFPLLKINNKG